MRSLRLVRSCAVVMMIPALLASVVYAQGAAGGTPVVQGMERAFMDTTCAACADFYRFANGRWMATAKIPAEYPGWGVAYELYDRNNEILRSILDSLRATPAVAGSNAAKLGTFYRTCMDSARAEREGATPLREELARIAAVRSVTTLRAEVAHLQRQGADVMFGFGAGQDAKKTTEVIAIAGQAGIGLPERDYYLRDDSASVATRQAYVAYITKLLTLSGESAALARQQADRVLALETQLARASMTVVALRDPNATYHRMTVADLQRLTPTFSWTSYLREVGAGAVPAVNVQQPDFFRTVDHLLTTVPMDTWRAYLRFHTLSEAAPFLSTPFVLERFHFRQLLTGAQELSPRWKRCLAVTDGSLGEALGQAYVQRTFSPEAKARALTMVRNLEAELRDRLSTLEWMSDTTRHQAIGKLEAFLNKIGYPDQWRDYTALVVRDGPFILNVARANQFEQARQLAKIGKPVDRAEWGMTPPTVNAYYNPLLNEIVFPAGILQPPYFDPAADDAVNYGAIGSVIGHEMTHGFDDQGRQFDAQGNLRDWWTDADAKAYLQRAGVVSAQYDGYIAVDTLHVNGKLTLGENIADLGGLRVAYAAFEKAMAGKPHTAIDGFTPEQRFFIAYAQGWRSLNRPEVMRTYTQTDPHSPDLWRVNGPLANMREFAEAFRCASGDAMVRADSVRVQIW